MTFLLRLAPPALFALAMTAAHAAQFASPEAALTEVAPLPALAEFAAARAIPMDGREAGSDPQAAHAGDRVVLLFTLFDHEHYRQWLVEIRAAELTDGERDSHPSGFGIFGPFLKTLKSSTGHKWSFPASPAALDIRTYGPFYSDASASAGKDRGEKSAHILANANYLAIGLTPQCEIETRLLDAGKRDPGIALIFPLGPSFSDEQIKAARARAAASGFTEEDERIYAKSAFALVQFAALAQQTDGVRDILEEIVEKPGIFPVGNIFLDWNKQRLVEAGDSILPQARVFGIPFVYSQRHTTTKGTLFVTAPAPPLQVCAGFIGMTATSTKAPDKRLIMRLMAARR